MTNLPTLLLLGFVLGMRHATDADHVVAVSTIVTRDKSLRGAAITGSLWGLGHTATVLVVGGAIIVFDLVVPARLGLAFELAVGLMLVALGALTLRRAPRHAHDLSHHALALGETPKPPAQPIDRLDRERAGGRAWTTVRPLVVGVVHGLAGSAAVALLVLGTIKQPAWAVGYLAVFGTGTVAGMMLITTALAIPLRAAAHRSAQRARWVGLAAGILSVGMGLFVVYRVGFVDGLFLGDMPSPPR